MQILCEGKAAKKSNNAVPLMPTRGSGEPQQKYVYSLIQKLFWSASLLAPKTNKQTQRQPSTNIFDQKPIAEVSWWEASRVQTSLTVISLRQMGIAFQFIDTDRLPTCCNHSKSVCTDECNSSTMCHFAIRNSAQLVANCFYSDYIPLSGNAAQCLNHCADKLPSCCYLWKNFSFRSMSFWLES